MSAPFNVVVTGMGGQGCVSLGKAIALAAAAAGWQVAGSEKRGGAQRGGAAEVMLRLLPPGGPGPDTIASQIPPGQLDLLVGMEPLEAWRRVELTGPRTLALLDATPVEPALARGFGYEVPPFDEIAAGVAGNGARVVALELSTTARARWRKVAMANVLALAWLTEGGHLPFPAEHVRAAATDALGHQPEAWALGAALTPAR